MKLIATKRVFYPTGPSGKEYQPGDPFDALSERDARALKLVGKAKDATAARPTTRRAVTADLPPEVLKTAAPAPTTDEIPVPGRSDYHRRDMKAEE